MHLSKGQNASKLIAISVTLHLVFLSQNQIVNESCVRALRWSTIVKSSVNSTVPV